MMPMMSFVPTGMAIAAFVISAGVLTLPSFAMAAYDNGASKPPSGSVFVPANPPVNVFPARPTLSPTPSARVQAFAPTTAPAPACPAGGSGTQTSPPTNTASPSPSATPTVLGVTFDNPPPTTPTAPKPGERLPFTGMPLGQSLVTGSALIGAGIVLRGSRRRRRRIPT
jgi:hypothetical protein